jgi:hypothetical protein
MALAIPQVQHYSLKQIGMAATFNTAKREDQKFQLMKRELPQFHGFFHQI